MNTNSSTPPVSSPTKKQVGKLEERLYAVVRKSGLDSQQLQTALAYPGTELENKMVALLVQFAKKASGIITPVSAEGSGLIPNGWTVYVKDGAKQDFPEGDVDLAKLDYSICPVQSGDGDCVNGDIMLKRVNEAHAYGSLGFAAALLKEQEAGKEIFPVESRGKHYFVMPRTVLLDDFRSRLVAYFYWFGQLWVLSFYCLGLDFHGSGRFVCPRYYLLTPPIAGGVSFVSCFCQPPSILPISTRGNDSSVNFLLSIALSSQAICVKNLSRSNFNEACLIISALFSLAAKPAVKISSASSMNNRLIFSPKE